MDHSPAQDPLTDVEEHWEVESSDYLHRDAWVVSLRADHVRAPGDGGEAFRRLVLEHPGAVVVLAVDDDDRVCCLRQYRHPAGRRFVELPAGLLDQEGEEPEEVARRELREEVALEARSWTHLTTAWSSPGISEERMHFFLARGLGAVDRGGFELRHEEADMTVEWVAFADLHAAVLDGRLQDAPVVLAVLLAAARGLVGTGAADGSAGE
ncbi:ADP-ribose diphosphatase [Nocardioides aestuarii]|uniref:NUDIX domain-containing protein n=1 Tax=Nocardioides aestuarii TaxID=252231 RepID=A0ABW4TSA3_9ACTN